MEKKGKQVYDVRAQGLCRLYCKCYKCKFGCKKCDQCGDDNHIEGCAMFKPKEK